MSYPTKLDLNNQSNNLNQNIAPIGYVNSGNIYNTPNNRNESIAINIKNGNMNNRQIVTPNINDDAKNNLQIHNIAKERENNLQINKKIIVQKSVYQRPNNNIYYDNEKDRSYPLTEDSRNQMNLNNEYLAKINQKYNVEIDPNIQIEKRTEANEITQTPIIVNNTEVPVAKINYLEKFGVKRGCNCTCRKAFMMTVKIIVVVLLFAILIVLCALLLGGGGRGGGDVGGGDIDMSPSGGGHGSHRGRGCCCFCPLIRWVKSDKWCC
jgi:hypothetical protein